MATTANQEMFDGLVRHQTYLLRHSSYVRNRMLAVLDRTEEDIAIQIHGRLANNAALTTSKEWERLAALMASISTIRSGAWEEATSIWEKESLALAYQEPIFFNSILVGAAPVVINTVMPSPALLRSIALSRPFEGRVLKDWASKMEADDLARIRNQIQLGMMAGESNAAIARRVIGDGVVQESRRGVQAITRTAVQFIAANARYEFLEANSDVIYAEQYVATLDSRTTPMCRAFDGKIYPMGKGPRPPIHIGCRSLRIAYFDKTNLGERPAKPTTEKQLLREYTTINGLDPVRSRAMLPHGTKTDFDKFSRRRIREMIGPIPADTTYQTWLERQPKWFQTDVLGVTRAKLFRDGKLPLDRFVTTDGDELTLSQIAKRNSEAFVRAGLDPSKYR